MLHLLIKLNLNGYNIQDMPLICYTLVNKQKDRFF
jgi:hypothetical protein